MDSHLHQKRRDLIQKWTADAVAVFPADAAKFLKSVKDPFANPAGTTIATEIAFLFDALLAGLSPGEISPRLDRIIQLSSVQDIAPSRAVSFVFKLKEILRKELGELLRDPRILEQYLEFDARIDRLALCAFDSHAGLQQRLADIRVREVRNQVATLLRMTDISLEEPQSCVPTRGGCRQ